jgi:2-polyprenyl-6-hydroxyphenyl methylase/3-demethylubiquinone-9 3-methyltransferase
MNTVDAQEIQNFSKDSDQWWDINGPFKPLHRLNPVRLKYFKRQICDHFDRDFKSFKSYQGLSILDIGCGGGLVCEPMARLGGTVTGIDADATAIKTAKVHAAENDLEINYLNQSTSEMQGQKYDVVLALEIIEHVADVDQFVREVLNLCKSNGLTIFSTLNRTPQSYALGIIAAEYILRWVPQGTHNWKKFVKPSELARMLRQNGATPKNVSGMVFSPLKNKFELAPHDTAVNYFMSVSTP